MSDLPNPNEVIERIMQVAKGIIPESVGQDVKENIRAAIQDALSDLDVVTREEFDIQRKVLMRTRAKLDQLEARLSDLD